MIETTIATIGRKRESMMVIATIGVVIATVIGTDAANHGAGAMAGKKVGRRATATCLRDWRRRTPIAGSRGIIVTGTGTEIGIETEIVTWTE